MDTQTDEQLMQAFSAGEYAAFEALYRKHKGSLYRYFLRHVGERPKAEDLFQEVWSQIIAKASDYQAKAKFTTWLYTMARNKVIDHNRHKKVTDKVVDEAADWQEADANAKEIMGDKPEEDVESDIQAKAIKRCVSQLPDHQLECFLLREEAGMQLSDVAEVMGTGIEATKSRMRYAYKNLRECLRVKLGDWVPSSQKRQSA